MTDFLFWQAGLVREYKRADQFITQNFDFGWKEGSYGVQPDVNHLHASQCLDIAGCDIYHPTQKPSDRGGNCFWRGYDKVVEG